jgi:hypothetical protein
MPDLIDLNEHRQRTADRTKQLAEVKQRRKEFQRELEIETLRETLIDTIFRLEVLGHACKEDLLPTEEELKVDDTMTMFSRLVERMFSG